MALGLAGSIPAGEVVVPAAVQALILLKVASFDRALMANGRPEIVIGILYQRNLRESLAIQEELFRTIGSHPERTIGARPLRAIAIDWPADADIAALLSREKIDILYVTPLRSVSIADVSAAARVRGIRTWSSVSEYVGKGLSLGVGIQGDDPIILVNLAAARAEGADLSSQVLKLARVVS